MSIPWAHVGIVLLIAVVLIAAVSAAIHEHNRTCHLPYRDDTGGHARRCASLRAASRTEET